MIRTRCRRIMETISTALGVQEKWLQLHLTVFAVSEWPTTPVSEVRTIICTFPCSWWTLFVEGFISNGWLGVYFILGCTQRPRLLCEIVIQFQLVSSTTTNKSINKCHPRIALGYTLSEQLGCHCEMLGKWLQIHTPTRLIAISGRQYCPQWKCN